MTRQGEATIKLKDVAKAAGVSQGTASNVFSKPELVREEVREHVLAVARGLGYAGPSVTGRLLRQGKVNAVGVAAIEPLSYFFEDLWARQLMSEISEICDARGAGVALVSARNDERLAWNIQSALVDEIEIQGKTVQETFWLKVPIAQVTPILYIVGRTGISHIVDVIIPGAQVH